MSRPTDKTYVKDLRHTLWRWAIVLVAAGVFALWATWRMSTAASRLPDELAGQTSGTAEPEVEYWTCTMHPDVQQSAPGKCPKCSMELVPKYVGSDEPGVPPKPAQTNGEQPQVWYRCTMAECNDKGTSKPGTRCPVCNMKREKIGGPPADAKLGDNEIELNERARRLAEVATEPVIKRPLFKRIRTVGMVTYDETRHKMVSAWAGGRIDRLFADFTGMVVEPGDHLVELYSPELYVSQRAYLEQLETVRQMRETAGETAQATAEQLLEGSRSQLELLGVTPKQIEAIEQSGKPSTHLVIYAPIGGTIVRKPAMEGMYVKTGDVLFEIADLTHVWLEVDIYEQDLPWIQALQDVVVTSEALPGEGFRGQIVFVDPVVDETTRTVGVRVNVENPERQLKPGMFVNAEIAVPVAPGGRAAAPKPTGDYACPMHPWEQADEAGTCPICEMDLVRTESIVGYFGTGEFDPVLSIPREAVMKTGTRSLAYIEVEPGRYRNTEIKVGPVAQDENGRAYYPLLSGLPEGQPVVTRGNFAIDSQMQIAGKDSLFKLGDESTTTAPATQPTDEVTQTKCPVMGHEIDPEVFTDFRGVRVYFCCAPCIEKFENDPQKYIANLPPAIQARLASATQPEGGHHHD